ncbi:MAG: acyl carrier protein [bacterium]|nr:acyl carrier protein [bacterium]
MNKEEIHLNLLDLLKSKETMSLQLDVARIDKETSLLNDIALDSIQVLELLVAIENRFKVCIDTEEISLDLFDRFGDLVEHIHQKVHGSI